MLFRSLLLAERMGTSASILSAALGFWAAEGLTLGGAYFWWTRKKDYRPSYVLVDGCEMTSVAASADAIDRTPSHVPVRVNSVS